MHQFCAAVSVLSNSELCHIVGHTPEARTLEMAVGGKTPAHEITIGEADIQQSRDILCDAGEGPVGLVFLGCPHVALDELKGFVCYLQGKVNLQNHSTIEFRIFRGTLKYNTALPHCKCCTGERGTRLVAK